MLTPNWRRLRIVPLWLIHSAADIFLGPDSILRIGNMWCRVGVQEEMGVKLSVPMFENKEAEADRREI